MNGVYEVEVRKPDLLPYHTAASELARTFEYFNIEHLVYNKEGIAPDFESSDCQLPSQLHSHNQRLILRNVVGTRFEESERMREKMPFWCDENNADT